MGNFYSKLKAYKIDNRVSYKELGAVIDKNEDAFRMALKRETFSKLEIEKLSELFIETKKTEQESTKKSSSMEELLSNALIEKLHPLIKEATGNRRLVIDNSKAILELIQHLILDVDELKDHIEELKEEMDKVREQVFKIPTQ